MGSGARAPSACAPESAAHRPLRSGSGSRSPRAVPCPGGLRPIPGPGARQREGWPSVLWMGGGGPNTRTGWRMTGGRWRGGGVERKTPGLNRGIKKGGRKGKALLRSWKCWKGAFACGAQGTESPRWPRPRAREISPEKAEQGQRATLQGQRARLLHADGLRGCPPAPDTQLLRRENSEALHPDHRPPPSPQLQPAAVRQRPCCHRDTRTLSHPWSRS